MKHGNTLAIQHDIEGAILSRKVSALARADIPEYKMIIADGRDIARHHANITLNAVVGNHRSPRHGNGQAQMPEHHAVIAAGLPLEAVQTAFSGR